MSNQLMKPKKWQLWVLFLKPVLRQYMRFSEFAKTLNFSTWKVIFDIVVGQNFWGAVESLLVTLWFYCWVRWRICFWKIGQYLMKFWKWWLSSFDHISLAVRDIVRFIKDSHKYPVMAGRLLAIAVWPILRPKGLFPLRLHVALCCVAKDIETPIVSSFSRHATPCNATRCHNGNKP